MADETPNAATPGNGADAQPHASVITQYIKDLSVESPNSPQCFQWQSQPQVDVQFNINVEKIADEVHEVALKVEVKANAEQGAQFLVDLTYAGLFQIRNVPDEAMAPFLLVEAPRLIFPFARQIIAESIGNMGFPPLMLEPIDFGAAFVQQMEAAQAQAMGSSPVPPPAGDAPGGNA